MTSIPIVVNGRQPVGPHVIQPNPFDNIEPDVIPEEMQQDIEIVGREHVEGYEVAMKQMIGEGVALFMKGKPMARFDAYMRVPILPIPAKAPTLDPLTGQQLDPGFPGDPGQPTPGTLPEEVMFVLMPDYADMVRGGLLPAPRSPMWQMLFSVGAGVVDLVLRDFRQVNKQHEDRIDRTIERYAP